MKKSETSALLILVIFLCLFFVVPIAIGYIKIKSDPDEPNLYYSCNTNEFWEEYTSTSANQKQETELQYERTPYSILKFNNPEWLIPINLRDCKVEVGEESLELIQDYSFLEDFEKDKFGAHRAMAECFAFWGGEPETCVILQGFNNIINSKTAEALEKVSTQIPAISSKLAPTGWKTEVRIATSKGIHLVKYLRNSNEIVYALDVFEDSSCEIKNSGIVKIFSYANVGNQMLASARQNSFYSNSISEIHGISESLHTLLGSENFDQNFINLLNGGTSSCNVAQFRSDVAYIKDKSSNAIKIGEQKNNLFKTKILDLKEKVNLAIESVKKAKQKNSPEILRDFLYPHKVMEFYWNEPDSKKIDEAYDRGLYVKATHLAENSETYYTTWRNHVKPVDNLVGLFLIFLFIYWEKIKKKLGF